MEYSRSVLADRGGMTRLFLGLLFCCWTGLSYGQSLDPNVALVESELDAYNEHFVARDFDGIATHFEVPAMFKTDPAVVATSHAEVAEFFRSFSLQEGYAYSRIERVDIQRLTESIYYVDFDFSRYNSADETLFEGSSLYLFGNATGSWKIFTLWTGDRKASR